MKLAEHSLSYYSYLPLFLNKDNIFPRQKVLEMVRTSTKTSHDDVQTICDRIAPLRMLYYVTSNFILKVKMQMMAKLPLQIFLYPPASCSCHVWAGILTWDFMIFMTFRH